MNGSSPTPRSAKENRDETNPAGFVRFERISKRFGSKVAVADLDLSVAEGHFLALLGPSGCGKTTSLRILAGLERPTAGKVLIRDRDVTGLPPKDRDIAMVFQNYALYPHLSVADNIAYPLRVRGTSRQDRELIVKRAAAALGLDELLGNRPKQLSGGQRQRVALARAIVRRPAAFLMDEPLSNLDAKLRVQMRGELKHLQRELGVTTIYVTHDQIEATTMADIVAVMNAGRLEQVAPPREVYERPANRFVATFVGSPAMNVIDAVWHEGRLVSEQGADLLPLSTSAVRRVAALVERRPVAVGIRPEGLLMGHHGDSVDTTVFAVQPMDHETLVTFSLGGLQLIARFAGSCDLAMGSVTPIRFDESRLHLFDRDSGRSLFAPASAAPAEASFENRSMPTGVAIPHAAAKQEDPQ